MGRASMGNLVKGACFPCIGMGIAGGGWLAGPVVLSVLTTTDEDEFKLKFAMMAVTSIFRSTVPQTPKPVLVESVGKFYRLLYQFHLRLLINFSYNLWAYGFHEKDFVLKYY